MDLILRGGTVVDGTGRPAFEADIVIAGGRIVEIGVIPELPRVPSLQARGLTVAPGFIDIHSHSDFTLFVDPRAVSQITQGVTTEIVGNCGHGCAPINQPDLARSNIYGCKASHSIPWRSMRGYLDALEARKPAVNMASLVPNGNLRLSVAGVADRPSTSEEIRAMKRLLAQALEEGGIGYSTGLEYGPERACSEEEVIELCRVAAGHGGLYATHTRNRLGEAEESIAEAIRASKAGQIPLQISHISVVARLMPDGRRAVERALEQVEDARREGLDVTFDMHTRLFGTTHLSAALPPWAVEGTKSEILGRLSDREHLARMKAYPSIITALARGDWGRIVLYRSEAQPEFSGKSIAEISQKMGIEPFNAICEILSREIDDLHSLMIIAFSYREEDLRAAFGHPLCMVGSDATALAPDGPLGSDVFHGAYTWASWFFRYFVQEKKLLTQEEAIRRLTSLPAQRLGLRDRGVIRKGAWADLAVFDPQAFSERGSTFDPNRTAGGMMHVVVNGVVTLRDGELTDRRGGQVLRGPL